MLRSNRSGNFLCGIVSEALGSEVVDDLHERGLLLIGFVRTAEQVRQIQELGDSEVFRVSFPSDRVVPRRICVDGLFAVYSRMPTNKPDELEESEARELNIGLSPCQQVA